MNKLQAGVARTLITPPRGIYQIGYGDRSKGNEGVHDELTATALAIHDGQSHLAIVACDLLAMNEFTLERIQAQLSIPVLLSCSHTHAGPIVYADRRSPHRDRQWIDTLVDRLVEVVRKAQAALQPADLAWARWDAEIAINRREEKPDGKIQIGRNPSGSVDRAVNILQVSSDGKPLAILVNFACHGTVLGPTNLLISADWPGAMRQHVELETGAACLFIQGATANLNPDYETTGEDWDAVDRFGEIVAEGVLSALNELEPVQGSPIQFAETRVWLPLETPAVTSKPPKTYRPLLARTARVPGFLVDFILNRRYPWRTTIEARRGKWATPMPVQIARLGDVAYVGYGMEVFTEIGLAVKGFSPAKHTIFASLTGGCTGYLATPEEHARGGYEIDLSPLFYRLPGRLESNASEIVMSETHKLFNALWKKEGEVDD
jgi:neutral ceramidase